MKKYMWINIVIFFALGLTSSSINPNEGNDESSDNVSDSSTAPHSSSHKPTHHQIVHHSNIWGIQHKLPSAINKQWGGDAKVSINGFFANKPYTMRIIVNDSQYMGGNWSKDDIDQAIRQMQHYDFHDFTSVAITIQTGLQNQYGQSIGNKPVEIVSFKGSDINKMNLNNITEDDVMELATEHWVRPLHNQ